MYINFFSCIICLFLKRYTILFICLFQYMSFFPSIICVSMERYMQIETLQTFRYKAIENEILKE